MKTKALLRIAQSAIMVSAILFFQMANAQTESLNRKHHMGLIGSFGEKISRISSDHSRLNDTKLVEEGGALGMTWGTRAIDTKLTLGFYYSAACVPHTTDLIELEASANVYPLGLLTRKMHTVEPYLTAGIAKNFYKMHGYYVESEQGTSNNSVPDQPYLGNMDIYMVSVGTGVSISLYESYDFLKLFADVKYSKQLISANSASFRETSMGDQLAINLGITFGINR